MSILNVPVTHSNLPDWVRKVANAINQILARETEVKSYTVATLPTVTSTPQIIFVSDEAGGAVLAFSDGTNWLRVTDRAIVS